MRADFQTEAQVLSLLDRFNEAVSRRDLDEALSLFSKDPDVWMLGSEAGEQALGPQGLEAFFRRVFSLPISYSWEWGKRTVSACGETAWLAAEGNVVMRGPEGERRQPYRLTAVFERRKGHWLWQQYHGSEPAGGKEGNNG